VTCDKRDTHPRFVLHPRLISEVLSENTERIDKREKFFAYTSIASLEEYVLIAQAGPEADVFRRSGNWKAERVSGARAKVSLQSLKISLPLSAIYEGV
jgi:Uma2 family endonuclease